MLLQELDLTHNFLPVLHRYWSACEYPLNTLRIEEERLTVETTEKMQGTYGPLEILISWLYQSLSL
jgi:hypothetical protein